MKLYIFKYSFLNTPYNFYNLERSVKIYEMYLKKEKEKFCIILLGEKKDRKLCSGN